MAIIEIRDRTRGHEMLVGVVTLLVLFRLWSGGSLDGILRMLLIALRGDEGMTSATAVLIEIVGQLIFGVGVITIAAWSGLWAIVQDVLVGVRSWIGNRASNSDLSPTESQKVSVYSQVIVANAENINRLQKQIDAMKAESTWAKARQTGSDE
jgi:hypothetical protein